ncbi:MAG: hypothetical protein MZV70_13750 [Desulfobacterales bacterium]|nr:hypothetical protein [Desulfobacterales bacterium]
MKSALVNALGFGVLSKTTGCEAMFLHAYPYDTLREMFLFRPYDKATIWEQHNVFGLAGRLEADLMLWECMALSPAYVRILQHGWLKDSISTITNAYPDHEDIQGPAGINIPEVMTDFIPLGRARHNGGADGARLRRGGEEAGNPRPEGGLARGGTADG